MGGAWSTYGKAKSCIQYFGGYTRKRLRGKPKCKREDNIKIRSSISVVSPTFFVIDIFHFLRSSILQIIAL